MGFAPRSPGSRDARNGPDRRAAPAGAGAGRAAALLLKQGNLQKTGEKWPIPARYRARLRLGTGGARRRKPAEQERNRRGGGAGAQRGQADHTGRCSAAGNRSPAVNRPFFTVAAVQHGRDEKGRAPPQAVADGPPISIHLSKNVRFACFGTYHEHKQRSMPVDAPVWWHTTLSGSCGRRFVRLRLEARGPWDVP